MSPPRNDGDGTSVQIHGVMTIFLRLHRKGGRYVLVSPVFYSAFHGGGKRVFCPPADTHQCVTYGVQYGSTSSTRSGMDYTYVAYTVRTLR